jgi:hypothetical protein
MSELAIYIIYEHPQDYPGKLVVRRWLGLEPDKEPLLVTEDLGQARQAIPDYCVPIAPFPEDAPAIKEIWL